MRELPSLVLLQSIPTSTLIGRLTCCSASRDVSESNADGEQEQQATVASQLDPALKQALLDSNRDTGMFRMLIFGMFIANLCPTNASHTCSDQTRRDRAAIPGRQQSELAAVPSQHVKLPGGPHCIM